jgi:phosphonate transport system substrate-binding protein
LTQAISRLLVLLLLVGTRCALAAPQTELVFGIYPYLSPSQIVGQFRPLQQYLSQELGRAVSLQSAPDFDTFVKRTRAGEYDLIFTAPHMGRLAQQRDGYLPVAQTGYPIMVVVLSRRDGPVHSLADLSGGSLAIGARMSMTYQIVNQALTRYGLAMGQQVRFVNTASFSNVLQAVLRGEADAGATGTLLWDIAPLAQRRQLREIYRAPPVPGFLLLAHPRVGADSHQRLKTALFNFKRTATGKAYFQSSRQIDFRPLDEPTLQRIDPFTAVFRDP